jgi:hypothetical protein
MVHHGSQNTRHVTSFTWTHFSMTHTESNMTFFNNHDVFTLWVYDNRYEFKITTFCSVRLRSLADRYCLPEYGSEWQLPALTDVPDLPKYKISALALLTSHFLCNQTAQTLRKILSTKLHGVKSCIAIQHSPPPSVIAINEHFGKLGT